MNTVDMSIVYDTILHDDALTAAGIVFEDMEEEG